MRSSFLKAAAFVAALSPIGDASSASAPVAVPPAEYRPSTMSAKAATALVAPAAVTTHRIVLPPVADAERAALRSRNLDLRKAAKQRQQAKHRPLAIGFPRDVPSAASAIELAKLDWLTIGDGGRVARIELQSPTAEGLRLMLSLETAHPDVSLRFKGSARRAEAYGPYAANTLVEATKRQGRFLTPVLEGDTATIELYAGAGASVDGVVLTIGPVSHLVVAGESLRTLEPKRVDDIGLADSCNIDFACVTPSSALTQAANAVGKLVFTDRIGSTITCSGTMLNDSVISFTPYLLTANHCITYNDTPYDDAAFLVSTTNVYWFFRAVTCNSLQAPPYALQTGGAMLLGRSDDWDWALLRMFASPPAGVVFSAWRAEALPQGAIATALHHPRGDLLMFSQGNAQGNELTGEDAVFTRMRWSQGTTEVGSSGSALFTFLSSGGYYEVRGTLFGGDAACTNPNGFDYYSRLDSMLPLVRQYLTPDAGNPSSQAVAVEYYSRSLDQYFMTIDPNEINLLDTGVLVGWERTGIRFLAYSTQQPGTNPVCRYYLRPDLGDSHFYSADPQECQRVLQQFGQDWIFEASNVFYIALPDQAGACPAGTKPIWRFLNNNKLNHRYTPEVTIRDELRADPIWRAEGYGPNAVIMCSPASN